MDSKGLNECPLHGARVSPETLVGHRLEKVVASRHLHGADAPAGPLDVWLIDGREGSIRITTGSDWCLIVEASGPYEGYDMDDLGRIKVVPVGEETPFAGHIGETVLAVWEDLEPNTGRVALELTFSSGRVRCESWAGDLRLSA